MRCVKILVALAVTASIILCAISVGAKEYTPSEIWYTRPTSGATYITPMGGGSTFPMQIYSSGAWADTEEGLLVCGNYNTNADNNYVNHETFKMVFTFTNTVLQTFSNLEYSSFYGLVKAPSDGYYNWATKSSPDIIPTVEIDSNYYTITFSDIPWESVASCSTLGVFIPKANINLGTNNQIYILNAFLGLSSEYDEAAYRAEVNARMERIEESLDGIQSGIDDVNEGLSGVQESIDGLLEKEEEYGNNAANVANEDAEGALSMLANYGEQYGNIMERFITVCTTNDILTNIPLPSGTVNIFGYELDIFAGHTSVDFSNFLEEPNIKTVLIIVKCITTLGILAVAVKWAHNIKEWITSNDPVDVPDIPFLPSGGD